MKRNIYLNPFIVVLSGQSDFAAVNRAMESGANKFMEKPTDFNELKRVLEPYLES
jgi:FixJ family two-component response regulator